MTWNQLAEKISTLTTEQQNTDVTVFDGNHGEYFGVNELSIATPEDTDVLDEGHPYLQFE